MALRTGALSLRSFARHQRNTRVSNSLVFGIARPDKGFQDLRWQRGVEILPYPDLSFPSSRLSLPVCSGDRDELGFGNAGLCDHNLLIFGDPLDKARQVGLP
jgi:hypothetical protein